MPFKQYQQHGWKLCVIPAGEKGPTGKGWNTHPADDIPEGCNAGLLHALSGTAALDIDDEAKARLWLSERGIDLGALLSAPDAVQIVSGREGSAKLLFSFFAALPSKKVIVDGKVILELRCASAGGTTVQDVLPPSRHPSGSTYAWAGKGNWQQLPMLPTDLLDLWNLLIADESKRAIPMPEGVAASWSELKSAIAKIPPDCARKPWLDVGMGLHRAAEATGEYEIAFDLWDNWSQGCPAKYPGRREMLKQWSSFKQVPHPVTVGSIFHHAYAHGWKRPPPDIGSLFGPIGDAAEPEKAIAAIDPRPQPPGCDMDLFPRLLRDRAIEVSVEVGCDPVVPLMAGLAAVSAAADKRIRLVVNAGWKVPPTLWTMTIGAPADKKTPGSRPMFSTLQALEREDRDRYTTEMLLWRGLEARHASDMKAYRQWFESEEGQMGLGTPPVVTPLPPEPQPCRLIVNDATTQKVVSMAQYRPRGFLLYYDEMNRWLTKLGDPRNTDDRGLWIQGFESGPYAMDRQGAGSIFAENLALSLYGNCQPAVFNKTVVDASRDGIIQRFLPVTLNPKKNAMWQEAVPAWASHEKSYDDMIRRTFGLPEFEYILSPEAMTLFKRFSAWCLELREAERLLGKSDIYQTALGKLEGNCCRLILLFHLVDEPHSFMVSADTARRAIESVMYFFVPSMQHAFIELAGEQSKYGGTLVNFLIQNSGVKPSVSLAEIRTVLKNQLPEGAPWQVDQLLRVSMDELASLGMVSLFQDHARYPVWSINPNLAEAFKEYRRNIIRAKQAALDMVQKKVGATRRFVRGYEDERSPTYD